ncbi:MAG: C39 family peptidase [Bellilinea sp.]
MISKRKAIFSILVAGLLAGGLLLAVPSLRARLVSNFNELRVQARYALNPPQQAVFVPQEAVATMVDATMQAFSQTSTATLTPTPVSHTATPTPQFTPTATPTPTPLPERVALSGVRYQDQHGLWNYCAPANLAMGLSYWGWQGGRTDVGTVLKPFDKDKNVMPYEMADYVQTHTNLNALVRHGGTLETLKKLVAAGFVPLIEKGIVIRDINGKLGWMGHYSTITGYDDAKKVFITQDSYFEPEFKVSYDDLLWQWRSFNYIFLVIYPPEREAELLDLLGPYADPQTALQIAAQTAAEEAVRLDGVEKFFAYFNRGTSLVNLQDYAGAASTYDQAFALMAGLPEKDRPWRMMWYQTGPYFAYYYTGRYLDVERLATTTLEAAAEPYLEESFVWRARARLALGNRTGAAEDVRRALEYHPGFTPAVELANLLGLQP